LAWRIEFSPAIEKEFSKLDPQIAKRITSFLRNRIAALEDPRSIGEALTGSALGKLWKYRVGDYRVICDIQDNKLTILALRVGHRREVYRTQR
jgi:mRNA interferase RelE/StbE